MFKQKKHRQQELINNKGKMQNETYNEYKDKALQQQKEPKNVSPLTAMFGIDKEDSAY